jgi:sterol 3beta-glucosyltransferase
MKFVVVTCGTEGDTRPMALLCRGLDRAGHSSHLLAGAGTLEYAARIGVSASALVGDIRSVLLPDSTTARRGGGFGKTAKALALIATANAEAWLRATMDVARDADAIIFGGLAAFVGLSAAEALRIPAIGTGLIPITPTRAFASPFLRPGTLPSFMNRASHKMVNALIWRAFRPSINAARAAVCGLPPRQSLWSEHPMLYGMSPCIVPPPTDWPCNASIYGQWLPPLTDWSPPDALAEFLAAGEPPVYLGFGSMGAMGGTKLISEALAAFCGRRVLFDAGWGSADGIDLPRNVHLLKEAPHSWLFPRTALVIHHGGAGTSHAAVRAGVPSVVVPFAGDQFFWADRLHQVGVAPRPVPAKGLNANRLSDAISKAEKSPMHEHAAALGASMAQEDGLKKAIGEIFAIVDATVCPGGPP